MSSRFVVEVRMTWGLTPIFCLFATEAFEILLQQKSNTS